MNLPEYQEATAKFAVYPSSEEVIYPIIGLANEAGETLGKLKKVLRGDKTIEQQRDAILDELGDVLWYLCMAARSLGATLEDVAEINHDKLARRAANGTIRGDGDKR